MSQVVIQPVESRRQRRQFFDLPWKIYQGDPNWIPPLRMNQRELLGFKHHPFHDFASMQHFLATIDGEPVGRVTAIHNPHHIQRYDEQLGFFGFFESVDDPQVAHGLLAAAREWLAGRGINWIRGPINPSLNYEVGLLVDGWHSPPKFMMTYNPRYYEGLIESFGFEKVQDAYAFHAGIEIIDSLEADETVMYVIRKAKEMFDVTLRRLDRRRFQQDVENFIDIYNESLAGTWGFTPLSEGEKKHLVKGMKQLIVPELTAIAEIDGQPVAGVFGLLDYNPRIREIDGRLFPLGFLKLLRRRREIKTIRVLSTNVLPKYQKWGLGMVVLSRLRDDLLDWGVEELELSWVLESNHLSYKSLKRGGAKVDKTYRVYDYGGSGEATSGDQ